MTDVHKPAKRLRKTSKDPGATKNEPPKKQFPHGVGGKEGKVVTSCTYSSFLGLQGMHTLNAPVKILC